MTELSDSKRCVAEGVGTALLLATVVGSGIMGERLADGNVAIALLANSLATGAGLMALIVAFGPISGAHFNPLVTLTSAALGEHSWRSVPGYIVAQFIGAVAGVLGAHSMFGLPAYSLSRHARSGSALVIGEAIAAFGLLVIILGSARQGPRATAVAVGAYITAGYWFTSSTSFANPAVTVARSLTDTFTGIRPTDVPGFVAGQLAGAIVAMLLFRWFTGSRQGRAA
jgi:glycerol uptake facilitator-like aquaporin